MDPSFGNYIRKKRLELLRQNGAFTLRRVAQAIKVQPSFISKVEHGVVLPSEGKIVELAGVLREDPDVLLAMVGKVTRELRAIITKRPTLFGQLIRLLKDTPDHIVLRVVQEVQEWKKQSLF